MNSLCATSHSGDDLRLTDYGRDVQDSSMNIETPVIEKRWITPTHAKYILDNHNPNTCKMRAEAVKRYAEDMAKGNWKLNGETIKVTPNGQLLDGQHRLAGCVMSGVSFETYYEVVGE